MLVKGSRHAKVCMSVLFWSNENIINQGLINECLHEVLFNC